MLGNEIESEDDAVTLEMNAARQRSELIIG